MADRTLLMAPCHTAEGKLELRVDELEELVVATYGLITGRARRQSARHLGAEMADGVSEIIARRPKLAEWYLRPGDSARPDAPSLTAPGIPPRAR